ncbi:Glyoxalase/Bleomycin resistance protein/Dihydroxybiphenyl dioxygenase [Calocera cornea HHB12733]|uniref:Glyoxalase/Bleomycin resistance protein/Dihydroxybiphenyl dioxygenase n=1 Tax=Calocera cornea HHB12733 TaxID=1353952 RepID=A0A165JJC1_9BASI|nr:Glyoxalase/Bleomycin resistance protein/Dihydroxybiphenyl dioxygenase [Calocera cornea HHB12733]
MADFYAPNNNRFPIAHIGIDVVSLKEAIPFYTKVLGTLGWTKRFETPTMAGFGPGYFVVILYEKGEGVSDRTGRGATHIAFEAPSRQAVHDWYEAAITAGATGNGEPGPRAKVSPSYYAAHILSPEGYRLEALYHLTDEEQK